MSERGSVAGIVVANLVTLAIAWWQQWPLALLLWPYWIQNVIIGWYSRRRILELRQFSLEGTGGFSKPGWSDDDIRRETAKFFVIHFGFFHLAYFFFLFAYTFGSRMTGLDAVWILALALPFALTHRASYLRTRELDREGRPNMGMVMFLPYLRVFPMHLMILLGMALDAGDAILLFGALKTGADVAMHALEHRILAAGGAKPAAG